MTSGDVIRLLPDSVANQIAAGESYSVRLL